MIPIAITCNCQTRAKKNMNLILLKDSFLWSGNSIEYFATMLQFHKAQFIFLKHIEYVLKQQRYIFDALFSLTSVRRLSAFDRNHQILSCNFPVSWTFSESCDSLCFVYGGSLSQCRRFPAWNVCYHWDNDFRRCVLCSLRIAHTVCHVLHCEITSDVRITCGTVTAGVVVPLPAAAFIFLSPFLWTVAPCDRMMFGVRKPCFVLHGINIKHARNFPTNAAHPVERY